MGKVTGFMEFERIEEGYKPVPERLKHYKEFVVPLSETDAEPTVAAERERLREMTSPVTTAAPATA